MPFEPLPQKMNIPELEEEILAFWDKEKIFEKSLEKTKDGETFVFYEGPPTANAKPHVGGALTRVYKDTFPRYKTMRGFHTPRRAGWDTHGLPVELEVEKELGFKNKNDIEAYGIAKFNQKCRENVWKYKEAWEGLTKRIGFWLDFDSAYITYDPKYVESLWWIIKQFHEKGLLCQDYKVVPYCSRCGTSLSSHELAQGYQTVKDTSVYVRFPIISDDQKWKDTAILSWTTTPWTLPGNVALAVNTKHEFVKVSDPKLEGRFLLVEKNSAERLAASGVLATSVGESLASQELVGLSYKPLFEIPSLKTNASYKVYPADFVTADEGTGVVHTAVMYGEDDYKLGKEIGLPQHHTVDAAGKFTEEVAGLAGMFVKAAKTETEILSYLDSRSNLLASELYEHEYPFCWRCSTPLLYYARTSWFVAVSKLRDKLKVNNESVNWVPEHIKHGRFGNFLSEAKDWNFSRSRYWGTPLPVWVCENKHNTVIGSFEELRSSSTTPLPEPFDPHRPFVDEVKIKCPECANPATRVQDLVDVWFDSGSMPYAQLHYPFENKDEFDKNFPADFIAEAIDQTRGWFYTLMAVSTLLDKGAPYKNVISFSHVLDEKGSKMSKSKGNVVDPVEVIDKFGADPLRYYLMLANFVSGPKPFSEKHVGDVVKGFFNTIWNSYSFFLSYANIDKWTPENMNTKFVQYTDRPLLDRWILAATTKLVKDVTATMDSYDSPGAIRAIEKYVDELSNWYIRRSRRRFWKSGDTADKESAYQTLYESLTTLSLVMAPVTPFTSEYFYRRLTGTESVHLADWPAVKEMLMNEELRKTVQTVREVVAYGLAKRAEASIKVRQPLAKITITKWIGEPLSIEAEEMIKDELNVKAVEYSKEGEYLGAEIDTVVTEELAAEGVMRELVRQIQGLRKDAGFEVIDRIQVFVKHDVNTKSAAMKFRQVIMDEVLATDLEESDELPDKLDITKVVSVNDESVTIGLKRVAT